MVLAIIVLSGTTFSAPCAEGRGRSANPAAAAASAAPQHAVLPAWSLSGTLIRDQITIAQGSSDAPLWDHVEAFYASRGDQTAWMSGTGRDAARVFRDRLQRAEEDGLDPVRYAAPTPLSAAHESEAELREAIVRDVAVTAAIIRFALDLALGTGRSPDELREQEVVDIVSGARDGRSAEHAIAALEPPHPEYHELRGALQHYRQIAARGAWQPLPDGILLRQQGASRTAGHDAGEILMRLCLGLAVRGDLNDPPERCLAADAPPGEGERRGDGGFLDEGDAAGALVYDDWLEAGVRRFQARHGLVVDGIVGPRTIAAFNVPADDRVRQIVLNMDRWRQLPRDLGRAHVRVNIPAFRLYAVRDDEPALEMRAVVGRPRTPTPVMSDTISYLELRPYWNVPRNLMRRDVLPRILKDPSYLARMGFDVIDGWEYPPRIVDPASIDWSQARDHFPYRLRQRPGRQNAMGLVKFMFPNQYHVYLHDTPARHLFDRRPRAYSAGCVRVGDPIGLADFLLQDDPEWFPETIEAAMQAGPRRIVHLHEPVPVHLTYFTAFAEGDHVQFRADLYGHDRRAAERSSGV